MRPKRSLMTLKKAEIPNFYFRYEQFFQIGRECCFAQYKFNADGSINVINNSKNLTENSWSHSDGIAVVSFPNENPLRAML